MLYYSVYMYSIVCVLYVLYILLYVYVYYILVILCGYGTII